MWNATRDNNSVPVALWVSSSDSTVTLPFEVNPVSGRLKVEVQWSWSGDVTWPTSSVDWHPAVFDGTTGKVVTDKDISVAWFDTTRTWAVSQWEIAWDDDKENIVVWMDSDSVEYGISVDMFENQTGATIGKGSPIYVSGAVWASGKVSWAKFIADGSIDNKYFVGFAHDDVTTGNSWVVITGQARIRGLDTSSWTAWTELYPSATVAGAYQTTAPTTFKTPIAFVITQHATNWVIEVRYTPWLKNTDIVWLSYGTTAWTVLEGSRDALYPKLASANAFTNTGNNTFAGNVWIQKTIPLEPLHVWWTIASDWRLIGNYAHASTWREIIIWWTSRDTSTIHQIFWTWNLHIDSRDSTWLYLNYYSNSNVLACQWWGSLLVWTTTSGGYKANINGTLFSLEHWRSERVSYFSGDLDTLLTWGVYNANSPTNKPAWSSTWGYIEVFVHNNNWTTTNTYIMQRWTDLSGSTPLVAVRIRSAGTWQSWKTL